MFPFLSLIVPFLLFCITAMFLYIPSLSNTVNEFVDKNEEKFRSELSANMITEATKLPPNIDFKSEMHRATVTSYYNNILLFTYNTIDRRPEFRKPLDWLASLRKDIVFTIFLMSAVIILQLLITVLWSPNYILENITEKRLGQYVENIDNLLIESEKINLGLKRF